MSRDFQITGPSLVRVKNGGHWSGTPYTEVNELGMASEPIKIEFSRYYNEVVPSDFGDKIPADVSWNMGDCRIKMKLIHFDPLVLHACMSDSMAGGGRVTFDPVLPDPTVRPGLDMRGAGRCLGNGLPQFASGNYYISLNISSPFDFAGQRHRFFYCYLAEQPVTYPVGAEATAAELIWRAVPYSPVWVSGDVSEDPDVVKINQGTNNGPEWTDQFLTIEPTSVTRSPITYTLVKEVLSAGAALWDDGQDD